MLSGIHALKSRLDDWKSVLSSRVIPLKYYYSIDFSTFSKNIQCGPSISDIQIRVHDGRLNKIIEMDTPKSSVLREWVLKLNPPRMSKIYFYYHYFKRYI
jgi:hypothetical protein